MEKNARFFGEEREVAYCKKFLYILDCDEKKGIPSMPFSISKMDAFWSIYAIIGRIFLLVMAIFFAFPTTRPAEMSLTVVFLYFFAVGVVIRLLTRRQS